MMNQCNVAENVDSEIRHSSAFLNEEYLEKDEPFIAEGRMGKAGIK